MLLLKTILLSSVGSAVYLPPLPATTALEKCSKDQALDERCKLDDRGGNFAVIVR